MTTDHAALLKNLRRLGQVATITERRWLDHYADCEMCEDNDKEVWEEVCGEGLMLFTLATAYDCAVKTIKGEMIWR